MRAGVAAISRWRLHSRLLGGDGAVLHAAATLGQDDVTTSSATMSSAVRQGQRLGHGEDRAGGVPACVSHRCAGCAPGRALRRGHVNVQRTNLIDSGSPTLVETLLHAFLRTNSSTTPFDRGADVTDQPTPPPSARALRRAWAGAYIMPGFGLAKKAAEVFEEDRGRGLILLKHGIFTSRHRARGL